MMKPTHSSIESIEVIPMNKQSIFGEPYSEEEIFACTLDYDQWERTMLPRITMSVDTRIGEWYGMGYDYLPETRQISAKFKGFMFAPAAKYGTAVLAAKTRRADSIQDILDQDFSNCFLYMVGGREVAYNTHPDPFDPSITTDEFDEIMRSHTTKKYEYIIRYAEIE